MSRLDDLIAEYCPDGVEYRELQEIFTIRNGYTPSKRESTFWENGTIPWFRMEDIRLNGRVLFDSIQHITPRSVKGSLFPADSIIISTLATIGLHALIKNDFLANQQFTCLTRKPTYQNLLLPEFISYYCFILAEWCQNNINVSGFASVDMSAFKTFLFPIPPIIVQREIVHILDKMTELERELEAELEARILQYEHYRDDLLDFNSDVPRPPHLTHLLQTLCPDGVRFGKIEEVCVRILSGGTPNASHPEYYDGDIPWLRTQEVDYKEIWDTDIKISLEGFKNSSANWISTNSVIVAMYGASAARVAINKIPLTTNQACCNLEIDEKKANYRFVFYWLSSQYESLKALSEGAQPNLNAGKVKNYPIPLPPLPIQEEIVAILDRFEALVSDLKDGLPAEIAARRKQYEYYRSQLLTFKPKPPHPFNSPSKEGVD